MAWSSRQKAPRFYLSRQMVRCKLLFREIQRMMQRTARIERCAARRAGRIACEILCDGLLMAAGTTHYCQLIELFARPHLRRMAGEFSMTLVAGKVCAAAEKLDGDNVARSVPVRAAGLRIQRQTAHGDGAYVQGPVAGCGCVGQAAYFTVTATADEVEPASKPSPP
jgi:hypothetical protein